MDLIFGRKGIKMTLKIEYASKYELLELCRKHPENVEETQRDYANAQAELDTANMELEICTAELVDEICKTRTVPATAKQEIRRAEIQLNPKWKLAKQKAISANTNALILKGAVNGMFARTAFLQIIAKTELRVQFYDTQTMNRDNTLPETKAKRASESLDLPDY